MFSNLAQTICPVIFVAIFSSFYTLGGKFIFFHTVVLQIWCSCFFRIVYSTFWPEEKNVQLSALFLISITSVLIKSYKLNFFSMWHSVLISTSEQLTPPGHTFLHFCLLECPCCLVECDIYSQFCHVECTV